jgi:AraC-like DNA-binding protein
LAPTELVICRPEMAGEWTIERPYTVIALQIEEGLFRRHVSNPMTLVGRHLGLSATLNDTLIRILDASVAVSKEGRFKTAGRNLGCSFLHMLALAPGAQVSVARAERQAVELRRAQIKGFIQENYATLDLSTQDIADHLRITPRYVQMALAEEGLTPSAYLRTCRLEAARRLLSSSTFSARSITEIALDCGFENFAHFSTEFSKRFGKSPRSYREPAPGLRAPTAA